MAGDDLSVQAQVEVPSVPLDVSSAPQGSPTVTTPPVGLIAVPTATDTQRRQGSMTPPRRRDSQPDATARDAEAVSALDPIAESVAKDNKRLIRRLVKLSKELNETVQADEQNFNLAHNAKGRTIRMPDMVHYPDIYQEVRELLEGEGSIELRRFQEASMKADQIIAVSWSGNGVPCADTSFRKYGIKCIFVSEHIFHLN